MKKYAEESGQALVLVLLSLSVVLTLVLFILSRSATDILITSKSEETSRAFSAAEAGIEQALVIGTGGSTSNLGNNAGYTSTVSDFAEGSYNFNNPVELNSGESETVWFVSHDSTGALACGAGNPCFTGNTIKVCWGKIGTSGTSSTAPAVEMTVFYEATPGSLATIKIARITLDPNAGRRASNSFGLTDAGTCTLDGTGYQFQKTISFSDLGIPAASYNAANGLQFARIKMFYNSDATHPVGFSTNFAGSSTLPSQGQSVVSTGYTCASAGNCSLGTSQQSVRRIDVFQGWPEIPGILDNVIYSSTGITK